MSEPTLFDRLRGTYGIAGAVDIFVDRLYANASAHKKPEVAKFPVTAWSIEHSGGPKSYPRRDMMASHAHLKASERDFGTVALEIAAILSYVGVPEKEPMEFMGVIESYRPMVVARPS